MQGALPKYLQLSEMLIREIAAGHLAHGERLPPEREMAAQHGVSIGTLRKALGDLEEKRLLRRKQGSGNYVRAGAQAGVYAFLRLEKVTGGGLPTAEVLDVARLTKPATAPNFGPAPDAVRFRRLRMLDADVVALEEIWLDGSRTGPIEASDLSQSLYLHYRDRLGLVIARVEDRVGVAAVPEWRDRRFGVAAGETTAHVERVSWASDGERCEYSRTWFDSEKARYTSRMGQGALG